MLHLFNQRSRPLIPFLLFICFFVVFHSPHGLITCLSAPQQNHQLLILVTTVSHVKSSICCKSPKKVRGKTSTVSSLKLKESPTARDLRKPNAPSIKQLCLKEFYVDKLSKFFKEISQWHWILWKRGKFKVRVCGNHIFSRNKVCLFLVHTLIASHGKHSTGNVNNLFVFGLWPTPSIKHKLCLTVQTR